MPSKDLEIHSHSHSLRTYNFSDDKLEIIEKTYEQLRLLKPDSLKISQKVYHRLSRFETLFGFPFDGESLSLWVIKKIPSISYGNAWTVAINRNQGQLVIGDQFFEKLTDLERLYLLIHEARHSDDEGYKHVKCPKSFQFVSSAQPEMDLSATFACDDMTDGAYAYQAAFLFELYAFGLFDQKEVGQLYNSSISRVQMKTSK